MQGGHRERECLGDGGQPVDGADEPRGEECAPLQVNGVDDILLAASVGRAEGEVDLVESARCEGEGCGGAEAQLLGRGREALHGAELSHGGRSLEKRLGVRRLLGLGVGLSVGVGLGLGVGVGLGGRVGLGRRVGLGVGFGVRVACPTSACRSTRSSECTTISHVSSSRCCHASAYTSTRKRATEGEGPQRYLILTSSGAVASRCSCTPATASGSEQRTQTGWSFERLSMGRGAGGGAWWLPQLEGIDGGTCCSAALACQRTPCSRMVVLRNSCSLWWKRKVWSSTKG